MSREMKASGVKWIGEIPEEFDVREVKNIFNIGRGRVIAKTEIEPLNNGALYPVYSSQTVNNGCMGYIHTYDYEQDGLTWTTDGANAGTVFLRTGKFNCTNVCGILTTKDKNKFYLPYFAYSVNLSAINSRRSDILGHKVMSNEMAHFKVTYPTDYNEQIQIANFLDRKCTAIDTVIEKTKKSIEKLEEYKKAVITKAVTKGIDPNAKMKDSGVEWCPQIPEHWSVVNPKALFSQRTERILPGDKQLTASQEHGIIYQDEYTKATGSRVVAVIRDFSILKHVEPNDFVISMRSFQGGLEYSEKRGCISSAYVMLIPNTKYVYPPFYRWFFKSSKYINALQSTSNFVRDGQAMRYSHFIQIPLFVIPLTEQKQIANYLESKVNAIMVLIQKKQMAIAKWEEYKKSLIYYAVTGKIDCRNEVIE